MGLKFKDRDRGWKKILQQIKGDPKVLVGVLGPEALTTRESGFNNVDLAVAHEYGNSVVPERSFIRSTHDRNLKIYRDNMRKVALGVVSNKYSAATGLGLMGQKIEADIKATMRAGIEPPKKDGSTARLIDTGALIGSVTYEVKP